MEVKIDAAQAQLTNMLQRSRKRTKQIRSNGRHLFMSTTQNERSDYSSNTRSAVKMRKKRFENMLSDYEYEHPKKGQFLDGEIIRIEDEAIFIDVGAKRDAVVNCKEVNELDEELLENLESGDQLPVYVVQSPRNDGDLIVSISKGLEQEDWAQAERYLTEGENHDLEVVDLNRGGVIVAFGRLHGFVPNSHLPKIQNASSYKKAEARKEEVIGSRLPLKIIEVDREHKRLILSAKFAQRELRLQRLKELNEGEIIKGEVVNIVRYGVFVDLGGITGLIHVSELDWSRVKHPSEILTHGEGIKVLIKDVDLNRERVRLSRKALLPNPWESIEELYNLGDLVEGVVTFIKDYGAFVRLSTGLEGLIHVSQMYGRPEDTLAIGQTVLVRIIKIDSRRERIGLSLTQVSQDENISWLMNADEGETESLENI